MLYQVTGKYTIKTSKQTIHGENIVLTSLWTLLADQHIGNGSIIEIDALELGTGTTAPVIADTSLETKVVTDPATITRANQSAGSTSATLQFFIPDAQLPNGTYTELGLRADTTLITRSLISPSFTKSSNEDVTVEYTISYQSVV